MPTTTPSPNWACTTSSPSENEARPPPPPRRRGSGADAPPPQRGRGRRPGRGLLVAVGELHRDLVDEAAAQVPVAPAEEHPRARVREVELALRAGDPHVGEPPLLLEVARLDRAHVREHAVLEADDEDDPELEALGVVEGHQRDDALVVAQVVLLGEERELLEELLNRALLGGGVVLARHAHQLLEVLEPALRLDRALRLKGLGVAALLERLGEQVADPRAALHALAQPLHHGHEAAHGLDRRGREAGNRLGLGRHVPDRLPDRVRVAHQPPLASSTRCRAAASSRRARTRPCPRGSPAASGMRARP